MTDGSTFRFLDLIHCSRAVRKKHREERSIWEAKASREDVFAPALALVPVVLETLLTLVLAEKMIEVEGQPYVASTKYRKDLARATLQA